MHTIELEGPAVHGHSISGHLFSDLPAALVEGAERSLRLTIEGRSVGKGPQPRWLKSASDFAVSGSPERLIVDARPMRETMADRFEQAALFEEIDPNKSPLDLFEDALEDAVHGNADSDRFDPGLFKVFEQLGHLLDRGVTRIRIMNGRTVDLDEASWARVRALTAVSFAPQKVRVAGQLNVIQHSDCRFALLLDDETRLQGTAQEPGAAALQENFGKRVVVTGTAVFRASGRPLRVEADRIDPASEADLRIFGSLPKPTLAPLDSRDLRESALGKAGLPALLGQWPGDESDEVVFAALKSRS
jgi:hypothetical protein